MSTVINKSEIITKVTQFYPDSTINKADVSWEVASLIVYEVNAEMSVGGGFLRTYLDDDYAIDVELACVYGNYLFQEKCKIAPTNVYIEHGKKGVLMEWIPYKPLYITSAIDYINLYKSFTEYLEDTPNANMADKKPSNKSKFKIYFRGLYLSERYEPKKEKMINKTLEDNPFEKYFKSLPMTIYTPDAIFQSNNTEIFIP